MWQLFDQRQNGTLQRNLVELISQSDTTVPQESYASDVMLRKLNGDRIPEMVFTSRYGGGVRIVRIWSYLSELNEMAGYDFTTVDAATADNPHRLMARNIPASEGVEVFCANGHTNQLTRLNIYPGNVTLKPLVLVGGVSTGSDPEGMPDTKGVVSYNEFVGGTVSYLLSYANNTGTPLTNVTVQSALPTQFNVLSSDPGATVSGTGSARVIRWTVDIPAGEAGVKNFEVQLATGKLGTKLYPKIAIKQGTKTLVSSSMPTLKVAAANLFVIPNSPGQEWKFSYKPWKSPSDAIVAMETSADGVTWLPMPGGGMIFLGEPTLFALTKSDIPAGSRYFRAVLQSAAQGREYSSVFNIFLPPTTALGLSSKAPAKSGQLWTFNATQPGTMANLTVRFQSTTTPNDEPSWTDLPVYSATTRKGNVWTSKTYNIPIGMLYFRAISAAPGWVDSTSAYSGPWNVAPSQLILPPFKDFHIDFVAPAQNGRPATLYATTGTVPAGSSVRFQSKLSSEDDSAWVDMRDGTQTRSGVKWIFKTTALPLGVRDFRAICSAPAYTDSTSDVLSFEVQAAPVQYETLFAPFIAPLDGSVVKNGTLQVRLPAYDANGIQRVYLQYAAGSGAFKTIPGDMVESPPGSHEYAKDILFSGTGTLRIRAVVIDGYAPPSTSPSNICTVVVGKGGGTSAPSIGPLVPDFVPSTLKALGSVKITTKIGDDQQVYRAFLQRVTPGGTFVSTVGAMVRSSSANPTNFSCSDASLPDGTYYYQVVAEDYDGMQAASGIIGPFTLVTPQPTPPQANIDVVASSRFVHPITPRNHYNHSGMSHAPIVNSVVFNYSFSVPPGGKVTFRADRILDGQGNPVAAGTGKPPSVWTGTTTKASGEMKFSAPYWTNDSSHKGAGEGTYRITAAVNTTDMAAGTGTAKFTVGHGWNLPNTFTKLDYGLYWFKSDGNALRCRENQDDEYFDRSKPTVIYVHGWQPGETNIKRREGFHHLSTTLDYSQVKIWKSRGYNVGVFNWNQFCNGGGPAGLIRSQTNIYGGTVLGELDFLPAGHSMIYALHVEGINDSYFYDVPDSGSPLFFPLSQTPKNVCDLFFEELQRCMSGYQPDEANGKEFRVIGHSLGTQVTGKTMWEILQRPQSGIPLPDRIALLEIAQVNVGTLIPAPNAGFTVNQIQTAFIQDLIDHGVAVEAYQSTDLASYLGAALSKVGAIHDMAAYARVRPDYYQPWQLTETHNDLVRWYLGSFEYTELPAYSYWGPFLKRDYVGPGLSASSPISWIRTLMGSQWWYEQSEGKNTFKIEDDGFQLWDNRNKRRPSS